MKTKKLMSIIVLVLIIAFAYVSYNISLEQIMFSNKNYSYLGPLTWHRSLDKGFQLSQEKYLFAWENVPGNDNNRLVTYLNETLGINWVGNAKIVKADQDKTIIVSAGDKSVNLTLDENKDKAKLTISEGQTVYPTYYLRGRSENGSYNIYQENKPIVVYFWAIWCQYCAGFQAKTLGDPAVKKILEEDYILVAMDLDLDRDISNRYGVSYPPYVLFLDWDNNVQDRVAGAVDAGTFLPIVTQVRDQVGRK